MYRNKGLFTLIFLLTAFFNLSAQSKIYLVRHSEKLDGWQDGLKDFQPLTEKGIETSKRLADYFKDIPVATIYSSNTIRTLHTAFYLSKQKKLKTEVVKASSDTSSINSFLNELENKHDSDEAVVIVSHSDIIPYFLIKLGLTKDKYSKMGFTKIPAG